jgi:acetyl-CoA carboxylase biotin carboxyl carrier protein
MTFDEIKELVEVLDNSSLASIKISKDNFSIQLNKYGRSAPAAPAAPVAAFAPVAAPAAEAPAGAAPVAAGEAITSPMVGTYYQCPSPDSPPFAKVGDTIRKGQTLGIIEAMKIMNELEAEFDCKILEVLVNDGQVIEYDTPLFRIERV